MVPAKTAALYARISTKEGRQHLENQLQQLREFARKSDMVLVDEYTDQDSGAKAKRPGLELLMKDATKRKFDVVLVYDLSRLTRGGPMQAFAYIARLAARGVQFCSYTEELFNTAGPAGELFIALAAHIAQQERSMLVNRVRAGLDRARRSGKTLGRPAQLVDHQRIRELREEGSSIREIAAALQISKGLVERSLNRK